MIPVPEAVVLVCDVLKEYELLTRLEKKVFLMDKMRNMTSGYSTNGYLKVNYVIGSSLKGPGYGVCHTCFESVYGISHKYLDGLRSNIRQGVVDVSTRNFNDCTSYSSCPGFTKALRNLMCRRGRPLSYEQIAALEIPNSSASLACYTWLYYMFDLLGDKMPSSNEIHLEPIKVKELYEEYVVDKRFSGEDILSADRFAYIWRHCFPQVKIREFKAVSGKCGTCALLSQARRSYRDKVTRHHITQMHALHRTMYMGERLKYYYRRNLAMNEPLKYLSIISDGKICAITL